MKFIDYQADCVVTESTGAWLPFNTEYDHQFWRIQHACEGLATELGELIAHTDKANLMEELGDLSWYAAVGLDALGVIDCIWVDSGPSDVPRVKHREVDTVKLLSHIVLGGGPEDNGRGLLDTMKRWKFYGKLEVDWIEQMARRFNSVLFVVRIIAEANDWTIEQVLKANTEKLRKKRYAKGFSPDAAVNRNVESERVAIEGHLDL